MNHKSKLGNIEQTLEEVKSVEPEKGRNIMTNYDHFVERLQTDVHTKKVEWYLDEAEIHYEGKQPNIEKYLLFNAYCEIKDSHISNEDLTKADLRDYTTGNRLTLERVEHRLTELGWKG